MYEPQEDSELLRRHVRDFARGAVLDMGTGSGVLAVEAAKFADTVIGLDVSEAAVEYCKQHIMHPKILFFRSDLFEVLELGKISRKFDLIIFNPPYLPRDGEGNVALDGGREGFEVIERFLRSAGKYLKAGGTILLLFSSLTKKQKVDLLIRKSGFRKTLVDVKKLPFETLYVYAVEP